ncbi:MAG: urea transporter [Pseudomonas sp.]
MPRLLLPPVARGWATALLNGCSQIFLQRHPLCGLLILLAIAIGAPALLGGALLGGFAGWLTALRRGYAKEDIEAGLYGYNGVLLGLLLCFKFAWSAWLPPLIVASSALSSLMLHALLQRTRQQQWLPAYTLPFVSLSWLLLWLGGPLELLPATSPVSPPLPLDWLTLLAAVARGLGQIIFLDQPLAGVCLLAGLCLADRRAACWALLGSAAGLGLALGQGWPDQTALAGLYGYNTALAALALSQNRRQPWAPLIGIALALLLQPGFAALGLPALTAPFILACWLVQASLRLLRQAAADCHPIAN